MSFVYCVVQSSVHDPQCKAFTYIWKRFRPHLRVNSNTVWDFISKNEHLSANKKFQLRGEVFTRKRALNQGGAN